MLDRLFERGGRLGGRMLKLPRAATTAFLVGYGVALVLFSVVVGVAVLTNPSGRGNEVGFLAAPNWSITAVAIWPAMFYVLRGMIDNAQLVFEDLDRSPMAWLAGKGEKGGIAATWARNKRALRRAAIVFLALLLLYSVLDWWGSSGGPLFAGREASENEQDWSSIPANPSRACTTLQAVFSLLAFLYQGVAITIMVTFAATTILMARTMGLHGSGQRRPPLLVDIESNDPSNRVGFERFVVVIDYMVVFVALAFANFFLTRLQNAYLHELPAANEAPASSLAAFIGRDFLVRPVEQYSEFFRTGFSDFSSLAVSIGAVIALFQCFFFFNATLRHTALQARNRSDHELVREPLLGRARETGIDLDGVRQRLRAANVWPLGYSDVMPTLSLLTICVVTIVFYRIGVYLVFLWIAGWILSRAAVGLLRRG